MAFGLLFCEVKRPIYSKRTIGTANALAAWRGLCLCLQGAWSYLLRNKHDPRPLFLRTAASDIGREKPEEAENPQESRHSCNSNFLHYELVKDRIQRVRQRR